MNSNFINLEVYDLTKCGWDEGFNCPRYHHQNVYIDKYVSIHSVRLDQIIDVNHRLSAINFDVSNIVHDVPIPLPYYTVKTVSPDGESSRLAISSDSYKRLCAALCLDDFIR